MSTFSILITLKSLINVDGMLKGEFVAFNYYYIGQQTAYKEIIILVSILRG